MNIKDHFAGCVMIGLWFADTAETIRVMEGQVISATVKKRAKYIKASMRRWHCRLTKTGWFIRFERYDKN